LTVDDTESHSDSRWEPEWPMGDPATLMYWLEEGGAERLGRDLNRWLGVIFYASSAIWHDSTDADRRAFRDVALEAIAAGRRVGGIPADVGIEKEIYSRMSYLRNSAESLDWRRSEMARILNMFVNSAPMDISDTRAKARTWHHQPVSVIKSLRQVKVLLTLMEPGLQYLDTAGHGTLREWLDAVAELP
jgi:hypothetical protein